MQIETYIDRFSGSAPQVRIEQGNAGIQIPTLAELDALINALAEIQSELQHPTHR